MKKVEMLKDLLKITFHGSGFQQNLNLVKSLSGRKFNGGGMVYWTAPPSHENFERLESWGFTFDKKVQTQWDKLGAQAEVVIDSIPGFGNNYNLIPRRYQLEAVEFAEANNGCCLIGDDMGIGKTIEAMGYLAYHPELRPVLIIPPASVKIKWAREIRKWMPGEQVQVIEGNTPVKITGTIVIANYDIIHYSKMIPYTPAQIKLQLEKIEMTGKGKVKKSRKVFFPREDLAGTKFKAIVGDEIHKINNSKAGRTVAFKALAKNTDSKIGLSGTPIKNRPRDFFNILNMLAPYQFPNQWQYQQKYCGAKHNGFGWDFNGSSNTEELHEKVSKIMIRRMKEDVLPELPKNQRIVVPFELSNRREYEKAVGEFNEVIDSGEAPKGHQFKMIEKLKQLAVDGKIEQCLNWIDDYLESGKKLVVACYHTKIADIIYNAFKDEAIQIIGGLGSVKKDVLAQQFQNDPNIHLAVLNIEAASEGIDLYAADTTCTIEFRWDPTIHDQLEGRVLRFGQESDRCFSYYLIATDTIEEQLFDMIDAKREVLDAVVDGKETETSSMLSELLNSLKSPKRSRR